MPATPFDDPLSPRIPVKVWYRYPEGERQIDYPFICIDFLSAEPAFDLFHSDHMEDAERAYRPSFSPTSPIHRWAGTGTTGRSATSCRSG